MSVAHSKFLVPYCLSNLVSSKKVAFTLAEGATHVDMFDNIRRAAFTLAEVLITLCIIGVVAAMTIPTLMHKIESKQLQVGFKTAYSLLSQSVLYLQQEHGQGLKAYYTVHGNLGDDNYYYRKEELYNLFNNSSHIKVIGKCEYPAKIRNYNNTQDAYTSLTAGGKEVIENAMANGMCVNILVNAAQITLAIDTNGIKKPNRLGFDIFYFYIDNNDVLLPEKMSKLYTEEELEEAANQGLHTIIRGVPCSVKSKQTGNGVGCAYYAHMNINPDDETKGYWESLPY